MTSISSATSQQYSPLARLQSELAAEVTAGTINGSDQSALSSALTDIDTAMKAGAGANDGTPPSPDAMKAKIDSLIDGEVSDGKLTSEQAAELKNVFSQAFAGGPGAGGGPGGPGGPGGAGGGGGSSKTTTDAADTNGDGTVSAAEQAAYDAKSATTSSSSSSSDTEKLVQDFLKLLQDSSGSASSYGTGGDSLKAQIQSLIVNFKA